MRHRGGVLAITIALLSFTIFGCSFPSDYFGSRAVEYNREAEQATQEAMLLNIVRASQRRPMQFTGLQSVTGTSSTSGSVNGAGSNTHNTPYLSVFGITPLNSNAAIARVVSGGLGGTASISGGPTFTVPVLDTQEFYEGILTPIPLQVVDFYLQQGFPPALVFDLFISKIVVTRIDDRGSCQQFTFTNAVDNDLQFGQFQAMVDYLVGSGFGAERVNRATAYGPPIPHPQGGGSSADAARIVEAYAHAAQAGLDVKKESSGTQVNYVLQKKSSEVRTCFAYKGGLYPDWLAAKDKSIFCGNFGGQDPGSKNGAAAARPTGLECTPKTVGRTSTAAETASNYDSKQQGITANGLSEFRGIALAPQVLKRIGELQREQWDLSGGNIPESDLFPVSEFANAHVSFKFHTRSTEGILYYLGEVVRRSLAPEHGATPRITQTKVGLRYGTYPMSDCRGVQEEIADVVPLSRRPSNGLTHTVPFRCESIFVVETGPSLGGNVASVMYGGVNYSIPHDRAHGGRSSQVFELVKQILALNTSAKTLPTTTVISVVGAQ